MAPHPGRACHCLCNRCKGIITHANRLFCRVSGYRKTELVGRPQNIVNSGYHPPEFFRNLWRTIGAGKTWQGEIRNRKKNGEFYWVKTTIVPFMDGRGRIEKYISIRSEITHLKQMEEKLRNSERMLRNSLDSLQRNMDIQSFLFDKSPVAVIITEFFSSRILYANRAMSDLMGVSPETLIAGNAVQYYFDSEHRNRILEELENNGSVRDYELNLIGKDRRLIRVMVSAVVETFKDQKCIITSLVDITERKKMEEALQESERSLRESQNFARLGRWELRIPENQLIWSESIFRIFEINPTRFGASYEAFLEAIHPYDREKVNAAYSESLIHRQPYEIEHRLLMPDGRIKWLHESCRTEYDGKGDPLVSVGIVQDITERKLAELSVQKSERKLQRVLQTMPEAVVEVNTEGRIVFANAGAERLLRIRKKKNGELVYDQKWIYLDSSGLPLKPQNHPLEIAIREKREMGPVEIPIMDESGIRKYLSVTAAPLLDGNGPVYGAVATFQDITEKMIWQKSLQAAKDEAERANREKSDFLAMMTHELRTPMNGVIGMASLLRLTQLNEKQLEYLNTIEASGKTLLNIISDTLDYSKLEASQLKLDPRPFQLGHFLKRTLDIASAGNHKEELQISLDCDSALLTLRLLADSARLRQVLLNLLSNAIKFTEKGFILLSVRLLRETEMNVGLEFRVSDTGIGIDERDIPLLFRPYSQLSGGNARKTGGTGLGLTISRNLVRVLGGDLQVESRSGQGSSFFFELDLDLSGDEIKQLAQDFPHDAAFVESFPLKILIAEDNRVNQIVLSQTLNVLGYREVPIVSNGEQLMRYLKETGTVDLVFLDIQMPEMDGIEAATLIREDSHFQEVILVAITAHSTREERELYLNSGMDFYLSKPFHISDLADILKQTAIKKGVFRISG